jgi:NADH:ubiquinone oxidoreductase subunit F (NADH-binding)
MTMPCLLSGPPLDAGGERLHSQLTRLGPLPPPQRRGDVIDELEVAGLLGRGGAGFPVATKWRAVAGRSAGDAVVLVNGAEGEPLSHKDRLLMTSRPHLVIDGALLAADAVGAEEIVFYVGSDHRAAQQALSRALAERGSEITRPLRLVPSPTGYVAGEESAAVHYVNNSVALPVTTPPRPFERGVRGRPTLVQNVESLAAAALVARFGGTWYRSAGREVTKGTSLVTVAGSVPRPGVVEIELGTTVGEVTSAAGGRRGEVSAVLLGGYFGAWAGVDDAWDQPLDPAMLRARQLTFGCGVVSLLPAGACGVETAAWIMEYLASSSAQQCGPCVFGLRAIADATMRVAANRAAEHDLERITRWSGQLAGRGACRHPDGAVAMMRSALGVFADDFALHQDNRRCLHGSMRRAVA